MEGDHPAGFRVGDIVYLRLIVRGTDRGGGPFNLPETAILDCVDRKGRVMEREGIAYRFYAPPALLVKSSIVAEDEKR